MKILRLLLSFVLISIVGEFMHFSPTLMFILSALAIIPLAGIMGKATANNQKDKIKKLINVTN